MCTDIITHHLRLRDIWVINYLDDYIGVASPKNASNAFQTLMNLLEAVGLPINDKKVQKPGQQVTCFARPARLFVNRILSLLHSTPMRGTSNFLSPSSRTLCGFKSFLNSLMVQ